MAPSPEPFDVSPQPEVSEETRDRERPWGVWGGGAGVLEEEAADRVTTKGETAKQKEDLPGWG